MVLIVRIPYLGNAEALFTSTLTYCTSLPSTTKYKNIKQELSATVCNSKILPYYNISNTDKWLTCIIGLQTLIDNNAICEKILQ